MIRVSDVSFCYGEVPALVHVTTELNAGKITSIVGRNGSGKSTFARLLCAIAEPTSGCIAIDGLNTSSVGDQREIRARVGYVQQDPWSQIVTAVVFDEVAFGPRNLRLNEDEVERRVSEALALVGLESYAHRNTSELSGGEQQRLALAGVLAMDPTYLVLDEATSQLDDAASESFRALVLRLAHDRGIGVVQVTHDLREVLLSDRVLCFEDGAIVRDASPSSLLLDGLFDSGDLVALDPYLSIVVSACKSGFSMSSCNDPCALCTWLQTHPEAVHGSGQAEPISSGHGGEDPILSLRDVSFSYSSETILADCSFAVYPGRVCLVSGRSGAGKSTFAALCAGLLRCDAGSVDAAGREPSPSVVAISFQRPESQFFLDSVYDEIAFGPRNAGVAEEGVSRMVARACGKLGISSDLLDRYPLDLSGGQARRVAIACSVAMDTPVLILDEPTAGLDAAGRASVHAFARELALDGKAIIVISHDVDEWLPHVDDVAVLAHGAVGWHGSGSDVHGIKGAFERAGLNVPSSVALRVLLGAGGEAR